MTLRTQILLMVTLCLALAVLAMAAIWGWTTRETILSQTEADGLVIAHLLSRSASFADKVPSEVESAIGDQMLVEATIAAHLVAIAEQCGMTSEEIQTHLRAIVDTTVLDEFWVTDEKGHAYLTTEPEVDFTFNPDPAKQPQAYQFWSLLTGEKSSFVQDARKREIDNKIFKYAGVAGIDKPRIVQVGYNANILQAMRENVGLPQLIEDLVASGNVLSIQVVSNHLVLLAHNAKPGQITIPSVSQKDLPRLKAVIESGKPISLLEGRILKVMSPVLDANGKIMGVALVYLSTDHVWESIQDELRVAAVVVIFILTGGLLLSVVLSRRVTRPIAQLTSAAADLEANTFDPDSLKETAGRQDEIGKLAQVFTRMAQEVRLREQRLKQEVRQMQIEIDHTQKMRQVAQITESDYFQHLKKKAQSLKAQNKSSEEQAKS